MDRRVQRLRRVKQTITRVRRRRPRNNHGDARLLSKRRLGRAGRMLGADCVSKNWQGRQDSNPRPAVLETAPSLRCPTYLRTPCAVRQDRKCLDRNDNIPAPAEVVRPTPHPTNSASEFSMYKFWAAGPLSQGIGLWFLCFIDGRSLLRVEWGSAGGVRMPQANNSSSTRPPTHVLKQPVVVVLSPPSSNASTK